MSSMIEISSYIESKSKNYGLNSLVVSIGELDLYFSYKTIVAFRAPGMKLVVRENIWGPTTAKHLKAIDGGNKEARIPGEKFEVMLEEMLEKHNLYNPRIL